MNKSEDKEGCDKKIKSDNSKRKKLERKNTDRS